MAVRAQFSLKSSIAAYFAAEAFLEHFVVGIQLSANLRFELDPKLLIEFEIVSVLSFPSGMTFLFCQPTNFVQAA